MASLIFQVDNVAFFRSASGGNFPDPSHAAVIAQCAGADGLACHLREDRLHITDRDLFVLRETVKNRLVLKIYPDDDLVDTAIEVRPDLTILMPACNSDPIIKNGINFDNSAALYHNAVEKLRQADLQAGYFIDPEESSVKEAARAKTAIVELNCYDFVEAFGGTEESSEWERLEHMSQLAKKLGMQSTFGNRLDFVHIDSLLKLDSIDYISLGGAITSRSVMIGLDRAVRDAINRFNNSNQS